VSEQVLTNCTVGGPIIVHVKDGKIIRIRPLILDDKDASSWTIKARGRQFAPFRKTIIAPFTTAEKRHVYSDNRIKYPMKRVEWNQDGERHPENRGMSEYERISWDEALDTVASEIKRIQDTYVNWLDDIPSSRILKDGYYYRTVRVYPADTEPRGIKDGDIIKMYNDRGSVLGIVQVTERVKPGVIHSCASSAKYDPLEPEKPYSTDKAGCVNLLTSARRLSKNTAGMAPNSCLIEIAKWESD